jgi:WD40 repeat protein
MGSLRLHHPGGAIAVAFSADGKALASAGDGELRVWEADTGKRIARCTGHRGLVVGVAFAPDGKTLASLGEDRTARLWETATGKELHRFEDKEAERLPLLAFLPDGKAAVLVLKGAALCLRDVATGKEIRQLEQPSDTFGVATATALATERAALSGDGKTLAAALDAPHPGQKPGRFQTLVLWDVATGKLLRALEPKSLERAASLALSPDGKTLACLVGVRPLRVQLWDVATGKRLESTEAPVGCRRLVFTPDGKRLACSAGVRLTVLDVPGLKEAGRFAPREAGPSHGATIPFTVPAFSLDSKRLACPGWYEDINVWDVATGEEILDFTRHRNEVTTAAFTLDGKTLVSGSDDGTIRLWDPATGKPLRLLHSLPSCVADVACSPDGHRLASVSHGPFDPKTILLGDLATGKEQRHFDLNMNGATMLAWSPDGKTLATAVWTESIFFLWDVATGKRKRTVEPGHQVTALAFSPDGKALAIAGGRDENRVVPQEQVIKLWDPDVVKERLVLAGHTHQITKLAFSPDSKRLASASRDGTVRLWDLASGKEIRRLETNGEAWAVAFVADGMVVVSAGDKETCLRFWDAATGKELGRAEGHEGPIHCLAPSVDGKRLASGSRDATLLVWDVAALLKKP